MLSNTLTLPPGVEINFDNYLAEHADEFNEQINENVDGEESKESALSQQTRVHGPSFVKRGYKRDSKLCDLVAASENDSTSQIETHLEAFNSRMRV